MDNTTRGTAAHGAEIGGGYPAGQLAAAFTTALTHHDPATRERAERRVEAWRTVLAGMADGTLAIGSRTPVRGLPAWVTPEVVRGGFATGRAVAEGPLLPHETEAARAAGLPAERAALHAHHLTEDGHARLTALLRSGAYEIAAPEEAALLAAAWLADAGDAASALELLDELRPFAARLRLLPRPANGPAPRTGGGTAHRATVAEVGEKVAARRPNAAVETQREALAVWNPYTDRLLAHWLDTAAGGRVLAREPGPEWTARGRELLAEYQELALLHTRCGKHRNPKENQAILRTALADTLDGRPLPPRRRGLLQHAVAAMVRRRGAPGSEQHDALRAAQAREAALPGHHAFAQALLRRLSELPPDGGASDLAPLLAPVTAAEEAALGLPAGAPVPQALQRVVARALDAPIPELIERGIVPSAEVLAELVPQLVADSLALAYPEGPLRTLMAKAYAAFRNRRSLLLLNLEHQVRFEELPWVQAVEAHRVPGADARRANRATLVRLGELALQGFPATILPNPLISAMNALRKAAGLDDLPLTEELAADIFMGAFSGKFAAAAELAGGLLRGSVYERYYAIDYAALDAGRAPGRFAELCHTRAGIDGSRWSVAANGAVIEQAQILTTHNLAALAGPLGADPGTGWADLARRALARTGVLITRVEGNPRPLTTVKDAAYAWRQMLFHLSQCTDVERAAFGASLDAHTAGLPGHARARLAPALDGLRHVLGGGAFDADGTALGGTARRFTGWSVGPHWIRGSATAGR